MLFSCVVLITYVTCTWKTMHLVKLRHLSLPHYLGLTLTSRQVGLIPTMDFPSGPRPCHLRLPSPISQVNHRLHLVRGLRAPRPPPRARFLKPSLTCTYGHNHNWGTKNECFTPKCRNPNIKFVNNYEMQSPMRSKMCLGVKHAIAKWGRVQGMKPNDSQVHFHFRSCTHVKVANV